MGVVTVANSLVGSTANDQVGSLGVTALNNGNYVVRSPNWDNGTVVNAGAVTWGSGTTGVACVQEGFGFVGIEREAEYFEICKARIAAAQSEVPAQKEMFA